MSAAAGTPAPARRRVWAPSTLLAVAMLAAVLLLIAVVPLLPGYDAYTQDLFADLAPPLTVSNGKLHLLGTDALGRDLLSRLALAGRVSLFIATIAVAIGLMLGVSLGLLAGALGGKIGFLIMGLADVQMSIPRILLLIGVAALVGTSIYDLTVVLGLTGWVAYCRVARAMAMSLRTREFVLAATAQGASTLWNLRQHFLPAVLPPMVVIAVFDIGQVLVLEASLSFIGIGVQPPVPSWGAMIAEGQDYLQSSPWMALVPGFAIFMLVAGLQFFSQHVSGETRHTVTLLSRP